MTSCTQIESKLSAAFNPHFLKITNLSHLHADHLDSAPGAETHCKIMIVSDLFEGKSRLERHRLVHEVLVQEWANDLHATTLTLLTPREANIDH